jgi:preprotein translocase subunit SecG
LTLVGSRQSTKIKVQSSHSGSSNLFTYILYGLFILSCVVLIISILLQPGKADAGALFSSSLSSTAFGPRGTASLLSKITIGAAAAFMLIALMLSLPTLTGSRSVLQSTSQSAPAATPTPAPAQQPVPTTAPATAPATSPAPGKQK